MTTRRELLVALGALAVPLAGMAQQAKVPRLGVLAVVNPEPALGFFREGLRELGYIEGQSIVIDVRSAEGKPGSLPALAAALVREKFDIIVAYQTPAVQAAKQATNIIPIVMLTAGDPVGTGLIASLARPGGNITGMSTSTAELAAKTLELIRDVRPVTSRVAVLANAADLFTKTFLGQIRNAGQRLGMEILPAMVRGPEEFDAVFSAWVKSGVDAVIVQPSLPRRRAIDLALKHRFPSVSPSKVFADDGGLLAYAANPRDMSRKAVTYIDRILKGARPADLPAEQPTTFELVVNMKTARTLGLTIPPSVLFRASQVIE
jgi:putative tryptophan/tyrosine transport system substrate-binding protein